MEIIILIASICVGVVAGRYWAKRGHKKLSSCLIGVVCWFFVFAILAVAFVDEKPTVNATDKQSVPDSKHSKKTTKPDPGKNKKQSVEDEKNLGPEAYIMCKDFVKQRLKSPSTADFPFLPRRTFHIKGQVYIVKSYVDAQNSYGAMIRANVHCKLHYLGGEAADINNWSPDEVELIRR